MGRVSLYVHVVDNPEVFYSVLFLLLHLGLQKCEWVVKA